MYDLDKIYSDVDFTLNYIIQSTKQIKQELRAIKKLCDLRFQEYSDNEEYVVLSKTLERAKKEIKALKKIEKILIEVSN